MGTSSKHRYCRCFLPALMLAGLLALAGCKASEHASGEKALTMQQLIDYLVDHGIAVQRSGASAQSFFSTNGYLYTVEGGGEMHVFEYNTAAAAELDIDRLGPTNLAALDNPKLFQEGRIIVLYVGHDPRVESALTDVLGARIV